MRYEFLVDTYATERLKVLSVWSMFEDDDLDRRPGAGDPRSRSLREHMVHQCAGEDAWFRNMLGIDVEAPPLPSEESRLGFLRRYAEDSEKRRRALSEPSEDWWERPVAFFEVERNRAWVLTRRIAHTAHHRGQQTALLRQLGRPVWSTYGPTADTGGLPANGAAAILYPYADVAELLAGEAAGGRKTSLPGPGPLPLTERPSA
ncbi:MAG: DinB family protein [Gemmatimonadota bacterium]